MSDITEVENTLPEVPEKYSLYQNYPNPFNLVTAIEFYLPKSGFVTLKVFDSLGKEVAEFINESKSIGYHKIQFDASDLSSGIYFYQIHSGNFIETKKLVLLK